MSFPVDMSSAWRALSGKFMQFAVVGGSVFLIGQFMLWVIIDVLLRPPTAANIIQLMVTTWLNYEWNKRWTYDECDANPRLFVVFSGLALVVSATIFWYATTYAGLHYWVANSIGVAASMMIKFICCHRWAFPAESPDSETVRLEDLRLTRRTAIIIVVTLTGIVGFVFLVARQLFMPLLLVLLSVIALIAAAMFLVAQLYVHRHEYSAEAQRPRPPGGTFRERFAIIMPARHEVSVFAGTLLNAAWTQQDHTGHRLLPIINDDDFDTTRVAMAAARTVNEWWRGATQVPDFETLNRHLEVELESMRVEVRTTVGKAAIATQRLLKDRRLSIRALIASVCFGVSVVVVLQLAAVLPVAMVLGLSAATTVLAALPMFLVIQVLVDRLTPFSGVRRVIDNSPLRMEELQQIAAWQQEDALMQVHIHPLNGRKPNKPRQLNYMFHMLAERFSVFTVLDAESLARPGLLAYVDQAFQDRPDVDIVQGGVQLMNPLLTGGRRQRLRQYCQQWFTWHNLLEYLRWFSGQMVFQSDSRFVPLGGNTVFIRSDLLEKTGGWVETLTEDCALGVRATALHGAQVYAFYLPELATLEETPPSVSVLVKQRTRWNQGFMQTLLGGEWRALPEMRQRVLAVWILSSPFFQGVSFIIMLSTIFTTVLVKSPPVFVLVMYLPVACMVIAVALQLQQLREFGQAYDRKVAWHVYVLVVVTHLPYQMLLSWAALRAVVKYAQGDFGWYKTARTLGEANAALPAAEMAPETTG